MYIVHVHVCVPTGIQYNGTSLQWTHVDLKNCPYLEFFLLQMLNSIVNVVLGPATVSLI